MSNSVRVKKIGHCALIIEIDGIRILTDPGAWSLEQVKERAIDAVVITHEHADHLHTPSVIELLKNNPHAVVITNSAVAEILNKEGVSSLQIEEGQETKVKNVTIRGFGNIHADIFDEIPRVQNTGYLFGDVLFYPGDALEVIQIEVPILALPVSGPWLHIREALTYALTIKPKFTFPVHDGFLAFPGPFHSLPQKILDSHGIPFIPLTRGEEHTFTF